MDKRKYPVGMEHYTLYEEIGEGVSAKVHRALCIQWNEIVAIKILDFERQNADLNSICREAQTMNLVDHPNLLKSRCSFVSDQYLWVVMPYMAGGSCLHILKAAFQDGFEEVVIATILRDVLKGLDYLHQQGHIHRDVKAGNILIDGQGAIKLGDFGVSACVFDSGDRTRMRNTFVGTPCWMAPEVLEQLNGHDYKADIWSFGITALELAHGHAPFSKYPPMKVLLMTLQNAPPGLDYERDRKFSKCFKQMIASCLVKDPHKRPSAKRLLKHIFFKQSRSNDYIARKLLEGLPGLGDRMKELKKKEEDMLAQKKMLDGEKAELSQNEYKRGISDWNFNLEDVKAQASLINDDDILFEKDNGGLSKIPCYAKLLERHFSNNTNLSHISEIDEDQIDSSTYYTRTRSEKSDDDISMTSSNNDQTSQCCSPCPVDCENNAIEIPDICTKVVSNNMEHGHTKGNSSTFNHTIDTSQTSKVESEKSTTTVSAFDGGNGFTSTEDATEVTPIILKTTTANSDEVEEKARVPVIQQKGRFKVTSGNVDLEKVPSTPILHKSHSMQMISPHPIASQLSSPIDLSPTKTLTSSMFTMMYSFLQTNITQRESILIMMKQICSTELSGERHGGSAPSEIVALEKSMLEAVHDREKDLFHEITDLQLRLISAKEELHKLKGENAQVNQ